MGRAVRVYIVRHGETEENAQKIIQGQLDTKLNATGMRQAELVAKALRNVPFSAAYTSDLVRASETARIILDHHPNVKVVRQKALRERFMGELEGIVWPPPMGMKMNSAEKPTELAERAIKWWKGTMLKYAASLPASTDGDTGPAFVLAVSHGAFINALVGGLVGARHVRCEKGVKVGGHLGNTAICEIEVEGRKGVVLRYGDVAHLTVTAEETKDGASQLGIPAEESNADALVA